MLLGSHATSLLKWHRHLPQLREVLRKAEFVALDLELTGLHARAEKFLGVDQCYAAHSEGARSFMPVQLGLCAARRSESDASRWILSPASIYIFPQNPRVFQEENEERATLERRLEELRSLQARGSSDSSRASFLSHAALHLVCFQLVLAAQPLSCSFPSRPLLQVNLCVSETSAPVSNAMPVSVFEAATEEDRLLADSVRHAIKEWSTTNPEEPLELPVSSPLQRLLLHSLVAAEFPHLFSNSCTRNQQRIFAVYSPSVLCCPCCLWSSSERQVLEEQLRHLEGDLRAIEDSRGARELVDTISQERLLVVGHCCFYDFLHLYQSFVEDLPEGVGEFKKKWSQLFPCTFDTKLLAETHETLMPLATPATLKDLCELMVGATVSSRAGGRPKGQPTFEVEALEGTTWRFDACLASVIENGDASEGRTSAAADSARVGKVPQEGLKAEAEGEAANSEFAHDAGYDSLMTTMVFLMQVGHVLQQRGLSWENLQFRSSAAGGLPVNGRTRDPVAIQELLSPFASRVRLVRTQPPSINLGGKDDQSQQQQKRLLLMRNFPSTWQKWNIMKLWSPVWVDVQPIDSSTCWLATRTEEDARSLLTIYEMMPSKDFE
ncbi:hypothetical protein Emed_000290 [Eimeria media]